MTTKLTKLKLDNVGGFKDFELNFHENLTILIGKNGAGKTTILRSIAFLFDMALDTLVEFLNNPHFNKENFVRQKALKHEARVLLPESGSYSRSIESSIDGKTFSLTDDSSEGFDSFFEILQDLYNKQQYLPLFIYYPSYNAPIGNIEFSDLKLENTLWDAYISACQEGVFDFNRFFIWFKWQENIQREVGSNKKYEMVRQTICKVISDEQNIFDNLHVTWQQNPNGDLCIEKNGTLLNINQLSAGEKMLMILVADLARRLIVANPKSDNPLHGEGVVLIDEIDLHLHPSWQRAVVPNLTNIFPNCQFIITTHSPLVLSNVSHKNVIILEDFQAVKITPHTYGRDNNSILYDLMGVKQRPDDIQQQLDKVYELIEEEKENEARTLLEKLSKDLGENDVAIVQAYVSLNFMDIDDETN
jgi:predicted ATP-binding protein involved in virulence